MFSQDGFKNNTLILHARHVTLKVCAMEQSRILSFFTYSRKNKI